MKQNEVDKEWISVKSRMKSDHYDTFENDCTCGRPIPYEKFTKIKGDHTRHIEQLWDEIKKLKERVDLLEKVKG